jgi:hypothetical protein
LFNRRTTIISILQLKYNDLHKKNLHIFDIQEKDLKGFTTTEKDRKRGVDRFPPIQFRNRADDFCDEQAEETKEEPTKEMGYDEALALRKLQQEETQNLKENPEEEDPDEMEDDNEVKASIAGGGNTQAFQ